MRWRQVINYIGIILFFIGISMLVPLACGYWFKDQSVIPILKSMGICLLFGTLLCVGSKSAKTNYLSQREGIAIVALGWTAVGLFGALPFYFGGGEMASFVNAFFESVSGFTTTGSSILTDIEAVPKGLLLWRSFIQWLGGMGIIVLSVAILPFIGIGGMQLYKAEIPSPVADKLKPRIRDTAMVLWKVYVLISVLELLLLLIGKMSFFDSLCHTFATMPTGGFSTQNASIAQYQNLYFDIIIIIFMVLAGINFSLHYQLLKGKPLSLWKDSESRFFVGAIIFLTVVVTINIYGSIYPSIGEALHHAGFQVVSILTTTGFATADYELWPSMSQLILLLCMFLGGAAGSTAGGMKCMRVMLCFKYCYKELLTLIHPHAVTRVKIGGKPVSEEIMHSILGFLALYIGIFGFCSVVLAGMGVDFVSAFGAVAATLGNIGPGFGIVGPADNFSQIPVAGKWLLIWCMLLGRLEIFTVIILIIPEFWRK